MENLNEETENVTNSNVSTQAKRLQTVTESILACLDGLTVDEAEIIIRSVRGMIPQNSVIKLK
jgi:hypothetical protein